MRSELLTLSVLLAAAGFLNAQDAVHERKPSLMIQATEYDWCHYDCAPFDRPTLFFCFNVDDHILIGSRKADWAWMYDSHQMFSFAGKPVALRHNDRSIWVVRTDEKEMQLEQNYSEDVFSDPSCTSEIHRHWIRDMADIKRPRSVAPEAALVPKGPPPSFPERRAAFLDCLRLQLTRELGPLHNVGRERYQLPNAGVCRWRNAPARS